MAVGPCECSWQAVLLNLRPGARSAPDTFLAARWQEAFDASAAPMVVLQATHAAALRIVKLADLKRHAVDLV